MFVFSVIKAGGISVNLKNIMINLNCCSKKQFANELFQQYKNNFMFLIKELWYKSGMNITQLFIAHAKASSFIT